VKTLLWINYHCITPVLADNTQPLPLSLSHSHNYTLLLQSSTSFLSEFHSLIVRKILWMSCSNLLDALSIIKWYLFVTTYVEVMNKNLTYQPFCMDCLSLLKCFSILPFTNERHLVNDEPRFLLFFHVSNLESCMLITLSTPSVRTII